MARAGSWRHHSAPRGVMYFDPNASGDDTRRRYLQRFGDAAVTVQPGRRGSGPGEDKVVLVFVLSNARHLDQVVAKLVSFVQNSDDVHSLEPGRPIWLIPAANFREILPLLKAVGSLQCVRGSFPGVAPVSKT